MLEGIEPRISPSWGNRDSHQTSTKICFGGNEPVGGDEGQEGEEVLFTDDGRIFGEQQQPGQNPGFADRSLSKIPLRAIKNLDSYDGDR